MRLKMRNSSETRRQWRTTTARLMLIMPLMLMLAALLQPARAFFIDSRQSPATSEWSYADQEAWRREHRDCAGRAQSPIDIQHKNVIISQHLRLHFYNYDQQLKFKLSNAHHTIKMNPLGAAYEELGPLAAGGRRGRPSASHSNDSAASSIHDIIAADEYVEFATNASGEPQHQSPPVATQAGGGGGTTRSRLNKDRLVGLPDEAPPAPPGRLAAGGGARHSSSAPPMGPRRAPHNNLERERERDRPLVAPGEPYEGAPAIKLDWLDDGNNEFKLRDIHFHWAERRDNGSEHAIDGRRAAMEMHLVHIKHGLDKSKIGYTSDSVAVVAILIESHRKSNADFNPIVNELARINSTEQAQAIEYKSIYDLLPSNLDAFYTYSGSLTTPPCYQVVNWVVMAERLNMNAKQIEMFRNLYAPPHDHGGSDDGEEEEEGGAKAGGPVGRRRGGPYDAREQSFQSLSESVLLQPAAAPGPGEHGEHGGGGLEAGGGTATETMIMPNVRHLQALNNRTILASFTKYGSRLKAALNAAHSIRDARLLGSVAMSVAIGLLVTIIQMRQGKK